MLERLCLWGRSLLRPVLGISDESLKKSSKVNYAVVGILISEIARWRNCYYEGPATTGEELLKSTTLHQSPNRGVERRMKQKAHE